MQFIKGITQLAQLITNPFVLIIIILLVGVGLFLRWFVNFVNDLINKSQKHTEIAQNNNAKLTKAIGTLTKEIKQHFTESGVRMNGIEDKVDGIAGEVNGIKDKVDDIEDDVKELWRR